MIEIIKYKPNPNPESAHKASFSIKIPKWGDFIIHEMSYFEKDNKRWVSFPSRQYEADGKKKYFPYNGFEDQKMLSAFQQKVLDALDSYSPQKSSQPEIPF